MSSRRLLLIAVVLLAAGLTLVALEDGQPWLQTAGVLLASVGAGVPGGVLLRRHVGDVDRRASGS